MADEVIKLDLNAFYDNLDLLYGEKDSEGALYFMLETLKTCEEAGDFEGVIATSNELGGLYRMLGKLDDSLAAHKRVVSGIVEMGLEGSEQYATALMNEADVHIGLGNNEEAISLFLKAKETFESCGVDDEYKIATLHNNISMVYCKMGEYEKAINEVDASIALLNTSEIYKDELATSYVNLGQILDRKGDYDEALNALNTAKDLFEKNGGKSVHFANAYAGIGSVMFHKGEKESSIEAFEKAKELIKRDFGETPYYNMMDANIKMVKESAD